MTLLYTESQCFLRPRVVPGRRETTVPHFLSAAGARKLPQSLLLFEDLLRVYTSIYPKSRTRLGVGTTFAHPGVPAQWEVNRYIHGVSFRFVFQGQLWDNQ